MAATAQNLKRLVRFLASMPPDQETKNQLRIKSALRSHRPLEQCRVGITLRLRRRVRVAQRREHGCRLRSWRCGARCRARCRARCSSMWSWLYSCSCRIVEASPRKPWPAVSNALLAMSRAPRSSIAFVIATNSGASISVMGRAPRRGKISISIRRRVYSTWRGLLPSAQCSSQSESASIV